MTIRRIARALGLLGVAVFGIFLIVASNGNGQNGGSNPTPAPPTLLSLETPNNAFGTGFSGVAPTVAATASAPANYLVLPLLTTTAPIVRAVLGTPSNSGLTVTAANAGGQTVTLPMVATGTGPTTGYYQALNATSGWHIVIRYPNSFQGSRTITTSITDTVGGVTSAPLTFLMSSRGSILNVTIASANGDGRVTSNPPGINCPGVCTFEFFTGSSVALTQSVTRNQTQFVGWSACVGGGNLCTVPLFTSGGIPGVTPGLPLNPSVTATFRVRSNTAIPVASSCPAPATIPNKQWITAPNCGNALFATLQCDSTGYYCCGAQTGTPSARCSNQNETLATCARDSMGVFAGYELIQPGGCYETVR